MINLFDSNITDILPEVIKKDPKVQALGFALSQANKRLLNYCSNISVYAVIDSAPSEIVDLLAIELKTPYYNESLDVSVKRNLVKNSFLWYKNAGTTKTVNELIATMFGEGEVIEWWEPDGTGVPYTFKIRAIAPITGNEVEEFAAMIANVINIRSHLSAIEFTRLASGNVNAAVGQNSYTINKDIKEGGL